MPDPTDPPAAESACPDPTGTFPDGTCGTYPPTPLPTTGTTTVPAAAAAALALVIVGALLTRRLRHD